MQGQATVGKELSIEVNYDPGLFVGLTVFDDSGPTPVQLGSITSMLNVIDTLYRAKFTPPTPGPYIFRKAVYTDGTFTSLDPNFARSSESIQAVADFSALIPSLVSMIVPTDILGFIEDSEAVTAFIETPDPITALVEEESIICN